jgi:hypothetical protein
MEKEEDGSYEYNFQGKCQLVIGWQGVVYNITLKRDATILDLKNRTVEMLGLEGEFFVKYGEMEVSR